LNNWNAYRPDHVPHPFSLSVSNEEMVIVGGITAHDPAGNIAKDLESQVRAAIANLESVLQQAGSSLDEIVYFKPYVTTREDAPVMDGILRELLPEPRPTAGALTVHGLADPRMKVEFDAIAARGAKLTLVQ
jgi:2-iminobutanoate/2-iminopropanoate deaminase